MAVATCENSREGLTTQTEEPGTVDVWWQSTGAPGDDAGAWELLDRAERGRAARFHAPRDRRRYIHRHAFTRRVLAGYLGCEPVDVPIRSGPGGKPEVAGSVDRSFNVSHDDDMAVMVVGDGRPIGVDVERIRTIVRVEELADGLFTRDEVDAIRELSPEERSVAFLTLWTRKEAIVKAIGVGLSLPLDTFSVLTRGGRATGRARSAGRDLPLAFAPLDGPPGHVGAVACAGAQVAIRHVGQGIPAGVSSPASIVMEE